jgi:hypothetical protein
MPSMLRLSLAFALVLTAIIVLANLGRLGFLYDLYSFPYGDKVGHFVLFGLLSLLLNLALFQLTPRIQPHRLAIWVSAGIALVVTVEELSQIWLPSRSTDWLDLGASYAGIALLGAAAVVLRGLTAGPSREQLPAR